MDKANLGDVTSDLLNSPADVVKDFIKQLAVRGIDLVPHQDGQICGNKLFITKPLKVNPNVIVRRRPQNKTEWDEYCRQVDLCIVQSGYSEEFEQETARKVANALTTNTADKRNFLYGYSKGCATFGSPSETKSYGGEKAHKHVPSKSWFPNLKDLDPRYLLTLFPDVEYEMMLLLLGRVVVGSDGAESLEGTISHKFRQAGLVVGFEAGLGKSTLLGYLLAAFQELGFATCPIGGGGRFGWGEIAESDFAYRDDLTDRSQLALLESDTIKTIITGGSFAAERKGIDATMVKASAAVIGFTNIYNPYHFANLDDGSISRWTFLYTYNRRELDERWGFDGRTEHCWDRLCKEYNTNPLELACYLLAHAAEVFLEKCGYEYADGALLEVTESTLEDYVSELRDGLVLSPNLRHVPNLVTAAARAIGYALAVAEHTEQAETIETARRNLKTVSFNYRLLYGTITASLRHPELKIEGLDSSSVYTLKGKLEEISNHDRKYSSLAAFEHLIAELMSDKGYRYPKSPSAYSQYWEEERKNIGDYEAEYSATLNPVGMGKNKTAIATAETFIKVLTT